MNKYQKYLFESINCIADKKEDEITLSNETLIVKQSSDITITSYIVHLKSRCIDGIFSIKNETEIPWNADENPKYRLREGGAFIATLDFEDQIDSIKIKFKHDLADEIVIPVKYIEADKEAYYEKIAKANREELIKKAQIKASAGADLVNIYFQPCCDNYGKTEIELYLAKGIYEQHHGMIAYTPPMIGGKIEQLIGKYTIEDKEVMFKSISGLAKRVYGYRVRQFSTSGELLFETDYAFFAIK